MVCSRLCPEYPIKREVLPFNAQLLKVLEINDKEVGPDTDEESISDILLDSVNIHVTYNIGDGKAIDIKDIPV